MTVGPMRATHLPVMTLGTSDTVAHALPAAGSDEEEEDREEEEEEREEDDLPSA